MNINVKNVVDKTAKTGRPYKALEVESEGTSYKVNVFSNAPDFANIKIGSVLNGTLAQEGNFWNITFAEQEKRPYGASGGFKTAQIEKVMDKKNDSIAKFQDSKEYSIKVASTMSGAVALAVAEFKDKTVLDTLDQAVLKWRRFLWNSWDVNLKDTDPTNDEII